MLLYEAILRKRVKITCGRLKGDAEFILDVIDPRVGVPEQVAQQILTVELWQLCEKAMLYFRHLRADRINHCVVVSAVSATPFPFFEGWPR